MKISFSKKSIAFGELHGILNLTKIKLEIIRQLACEGHSILICLERDFDQQKLIEDWLISGKPNQILKEKFLSPISSQFLEDQFIFFDQLASLRHQYGDKIKVLCVDIAFNNSNDDISKEILATQDEDKFDASREQFIIGRLQMYQSILDESDKIIWISGNMHASKTAYYFPLKTECCPHVSTVAMWLNQKYGLESIFTLPFSGAFNYQSGQKMVVSEFKIQSSALNDLALSPFDGFKSTEVFPNLSKKFKDSYDWIYGLQEATPSRAILT